MIYEKCWSRNLLPHIFPERIGESLTIFSLVLHTEFLEFCLHLIVRRSEEIDSCFALDGFEIVDLWPFSCEVETVSLRSKCRTTIDFFRYTFV